MQPEVYCLLISDLNDYEIVAYFQGLINGSLATGVSLVYCVGYTVFLA